MACGQVLRLTDIVIENLATGSVLEGESLKLQFRSPDPYNPIFQSEVARCADLQATLFSTSPFPLQSAFTSQIQRMTPHRPIASDKRWPGVRSKVSLSTNCTLDRERNKLVADDSQLILRTVCAIQ